MNGLACCQLKSAVQVAAIALIAVNVNYNHTKICMFVRLTDYFSVRKVRSSSLQGLDLQHHVAGRSIVQMTNDITVKQSQPHMVALLRARERTYHAAKFTQGGMVILTIALPVMSVLLAPRFPLLKPYLALAALVLLLLDTGLIERIQKERVKRGAKLIEEFDVEVLGLSWNRFIAGQKVDHEDVRSASAKLLSAKREGELASWYYACVSEVPLAFGRLICQRTNISYDARMRKKYGSTLLYGAIGLGLVLIFAGLAYDLNLAGLMLAVGVPFAPVLTWTLREQRKQLDTAATLATLKSEFEKMWDKALAGATDAEMQQNSRDLQNAIYQHRASAPLVFDWVYNCLRSGNEDVAEHAAQQLVTQAKSAIAKNLEAKNEVA